MLGQPNIIFVEIIVFMISLTESAICYSHAKVETVAKSSKCWTILMRNLAFFLITHYSLKHIEHFLRSILAMTQPWRNQQREIYRHVKRLQCYFALSLDFSIEVYWQWETYSGSSWWSNRIFLRKTVKINKYFYFFRHVASVRTK